MAWAECTTHGPIQDARAILYGGEVRYLECSCGLKCEPMEAPAGFVEHDELKELAKTHRQPREDHEALAEPTDDA
jgi:hypothetical protein